MNTERGRIGARSVVGPRYVSTDGDGRVAEIVVARHSVNTIIGRQIARNVEGRIYASTTD